MCTAICIRQESVHILNANVRMQLRRIRTYKGTWCLWLLLCYVIFMFVNKTMHTELSYSLLFQASIPSSVICDRCQCRRKCHFTGLSSVRVMSVRCRIMTKVNPQMSLSALHPTTMMSSEISIPNLSSNM